MYKRQDKDRYPYSLVWTPIPVLTWVLPFVGHLGVADSRGVIYDFAGPYYVGKGDLAFGRTARYVQLAPSRFSSARARAARSRAERAQVWDEAVHRANCAFERKMHILCTQNCHSHVATALDEVAYAGFSHWNMVLLALWVFARGRFVSASAAAAALLPAALFWGGILVMWRVAAAG